MKYPADLKILGLGVSAFDRLGLEEYFPHYQILTFQEASWTAEFPELAQRVHSVPALLPEVATEKLNTKNALALLDWDFLREHLNFDHLLLYKPVDVQQSFSEQTKIPVLTNPFEVFTKIENKANFRRFIDTEEIFPDYALHSLSHVLSTSFNTFFQKFGKFVLQDAELSGGRGTFFISDEQSYARALERLQAVGSSEVVVSKFEPGKQGSMQVCITQYGVFVLPLQLQVLSQPLLVNTDLPGADSFNGGQWVPTDFSAEQNQQARAKAQVIASRLQSLGYRGIFGIDVIVSDTDVYVIEVNARLTGMTAVIAFIQQSLRQIPFLVLHLLEHAGVSYELSEEEISQLQKYGWGEQSYGYVILFNTAAEAMEVTATVQPGVYRFAEGELQFVRAEYTVSTLHEGEYALLGFPTMGSRIPANKRLGRILCRSGVLDGRARLSAELSQVVRAARALLTA